MSEKTQPTRFRQISLLLFICLASLELPAADTPGILREFYANAGNGLIAAFTNAPSFPDNPTAEFIETLFEAPSNFSDNYGDRKSVV